MIKYTIIPNKKIVVAELCGTKYDAVKRINKILHGGVLIDESKYLLKDRYKVTVKCNDEDDFYEEVGIQIAERRLMDKYYRDKNRAFELFISNINDIMFDLTFNHT